MRIAFFAPLAALGLEPRQRSFPPRPRHASWLAAATWCARSSRDDAWSAREPRRRARRARRSRPGVPRIHRCSRRCYDAGDARPRRGARRRRPRHRARVDDARAGRARSDGTAAAAAATRCCSTTRTTARSPSPAEIAALRCWRDYDGVLAFGETCRASCYLAPAGRGGRGRGTKRPTCACSGRSRRRRTRDDLVWIGNWGDDERTRELHEFLLAPARALGLTRPRARRPLPAGRHRLRSRPRASRYARLAAEPPRAGDLRAAPRHRARAAAPVRAGAAGDPDHPHVRGAGLRHPAGIGAVVGLRRPVQRRRSTIWWRATAQRCASSWTRSLRRCASLRAIAGRRAAGATIAGAAHVRSPRRRADARSSTSLRGRAARGALP